jgi:hypothetical protein
MLDARVPPQKWSLSSDRAHGETFALADDAEELGIRERIGEVRARFSLTELHQCARLYARASRRISTANTN